MPRELGSGPVILNGIAEKLKRQSKDDFKGRHFEAWLIVQAVTWYFRYPLSRRDLESMFLERGFEVDHSTVNRWVLAYAPLIEKRLRQFRRPHCGSIRVDETYVKIRGKWRYLYRAIDKHGVPVDFLLTAKRDLDAAKRFFRKALKGESLLAPKKIGTDGASVYPTAISEGLRDQQDDPQRRKLPAAVCGGEQPAVREMDQQGPDENRNEGDRDGAREEARQQEQSADDLKAHHGGGERRRIAEAHLGLRLLNRTTRRSQPYRRGCRLSRALPRHSVGNRRSRARVRVTNAFCTPTRARAPFGISRGPQVGKACAWAGGWSATMARPSVSSRLRSPMRKSPRPNFAVES